MSGIGGDWRYPLTGAQGTPWTTNQPSPTYGGGVTGVGTDQMFPSMVTDTRMLPAPGQARVLRNPVVGIQPRANLYSSPAGPALPVNVPVGQVAQTPQPGNGNLWDALRSLFSGQPSAQGQGMTGMLQPRGQAGMGTDALGNPFNRFG